MQNFTGFIAAHQVETEETEEVHIARHLLTFKYFQFYLDLARSANIIWKKTINTIFFFSIWLVNAYALSSRQPHACMYRIICRHLYQILFWCQITTRFMHLAKRPHVATNESKRNHTILHLFDAIEFRCKRRNPKHMRAA